MKNKVQQQKVITNFYHYFGLTLVTLAGVVVLLAATAKAAQALGF